MTKSIAIGLVAVLVAACEPNSPAEETQLTHEWIDWKPLADNSFGYTHKAPDGTTSTERCWKSGQRYQCVFLSNLALDNTGDTAIDVKIGKNIAMWSYYRDKLNQEAVYPESGYSCRYAATGMGIRGETMSTSSGATLENIDRVPWSQDYVATFFAVNDPSNPYVYFNCDELSSFLENANEAAFLTSEITAKRLNLDLNRP